MSKIQGFLLHLAISATVVGIALAVIFLVWYPYPYFHIAGAFDVVQVLVGVDLVLGPALTLYLYRPGKPWVRVDLAVIAAIQIAALVYGLWTIHSERPRYMVFAVDRYIVLGDRDINRADVATELADGQQLSGPLYVAAILPADEAARQQLLTELLDGKPDIEYRPEFWYALDARLADVTSRVRPLAELDARGDDDGLAEFRGRDASLGYIPVMHKTQTPRALIVDRETARPVGLVDVNPFEQAP
ncbi:MAG: hypothetical protein AAFM91_06675 [Pseudomonadota bacterium]